jgi:hypothetical protein
MFTRALHWSLSWARSIQSTPSHLISLRSILILSTHLRLGLPSGLLTETYSRTNDIQVGRRGVCYGAELRHSHDCALSSRDVLHYLNTQPRSNRTACTSLYIQWLANVRSIRWARRSHSSASSWSLQNEDHLVRIFNVFVGFEVLTAVVINGSIFWEIMSCCLLRVNWRFGGTRRLYFPGRRISQAKKKKKDESK